MKKGLHNGKIEYIDNVAIYTYKPTKSETILNFMGYITALSETSDDLDEFLKAIKFRVEYLDFDKEYSVTTGEPKEALIAQFELLNEINNFAKIHPQFKMKITKPHKNTKYTRKKTGSVFIVLFSKDEKYYFFKFNSIFYYCLGRFMQTGNYVNPKCLKNVSTLEDLKNYEPKEIK